MILPALLLCTQVALAPRLLDSFTSHLPAHAANTVTALPGDLDRDGDLDLVVLADGQAPELLLNDGHGFYRRAARPQPFPAAAWRGGALVDVDNDGDLDLILLVDSAPSLLFLNQGGSAPAFTWSPGFPAVPLPVTAIAVADVNGDGLPDVFLSVFGGQDQLYLNAGGGAFADVSTTHLPQVRTFSYGAAFAPTGGPNSLPMLVRGFANNVAPEVLLGNGQGQFLSSLPAFPTPLSAGRIVARDVNGDQRPDVVLEDLRHLTPTAPPVVVFLNNGLNQFPTQGRTNAPGGVSAGFALSDFNGDNVPDLLVNYAAGGQTLLLNNGAGQFVAQASPETLSYPVAFADVVVLDADQDGDQDVLLCGLGGPSRLLFNRAGGFLDATGASFPVQHFRTVSLAAADLDGDGFVDVVSGHDNGPPRAYLNDGAGHFRDDTAQRLAMATTTDQTTTVLLADLDLDGHPDLVTTGLATGTVAGRLRVLLNDGTRFTDRTANWVPNNLTASLRAGAIGLVTLDALPDVVVAVQNGPLALFRNTGAALVPVAGAFTPNPQEPHAALLLAEVTGDNFLDLVVVNYLAPCRVYAGDGQGAFTDVPLALGGFSDRATCVAAGNLNGDALPDLVIGVEAGPTRVFLGTGNGMFLDATATWLPALTGAVSAVALADLNGDGRTDLVVARRNEPNLVYLQTVNAGFGPTPLPFEGDLTADTRALLALDLDDDRDVDLVVGNLGAPCRVSVNTTHQLAFDGLSFGARPNSLSLIGDPLGVGIVFFTSAAAASPPRIELPPYGVWMLGPFPFQFGAAGLPNTRQTTLRLPLPPSLIGADLRWQAVWIDATFANVRLGNQETQRILGL